MVSAAVIEEVYRRRYARFRDALAGVTGSHDSAHDAVQEAFRRALDARERFRGGTVEAWIWRIALNCAYDQRRRTRREVDAPPDPALEVALPAPERDPELAQALAALPARPRLVIFLRYFGDCSYAEIAEICELPEGTVAAILSRARTTLRTSLCQEVSG